jgi:hypothetical protein
MPPDSKVPAFKRLARSPQGSDSRDDIVARPSAGAAESLASPDGKTTKYVIDMERKWAEGVLIIARNVSSRETLADDNPQAR